MMTECSNRQLALRTGSIEVGRLDVVRYVLEDIGKVARILVLAPLLKLCILFRGGDVSLFSGCKGCVEALPSSVVLQFALRQNNACWDVLSGARRRTGRSSHNFRGPLCAIVECCIKYECSLTEARTLVLREKEKCNWVPWSRDERNLWLQPSDWFEQ